MSEVQPLLRTLAIETSCDETAVAVLDGGGRLEANELSSQVAAHAPFGGVVPELASREHLKALPVLFQRALGAARGEIELVAVTAGPGLVGALLVGVRFACAYAWARGLPLVAVDHLHGHLVSPFLDLDGSAARWTPERVLALVASGGHSSWYLLTDGVARRLGRTRDDAAGESFDKVAQALGLPYPGGPVVDRLARLGDAGAVSLPRPRIEGAPADFSFSGLKSAAIRFIRDTGLKGVGIDDPPPEVLDLLASFELAVVDQLLGPAAALVAEHRPQLITAAGGVAANTLLRRRVEILGESLGVEVLLPPLALTTDNAAMIGRAGQLAHSRGAVVDARRLDAHARRAWQPPGMRKLGAGGGVR
ncbi:MAG: tRNA (adenosine(37)-N6)-threonylcarbamoyltransferase complex transferase subunit TsaD [Candidatus Aminicenantes bacterium]|nr:MAG: tRNA (adenosine(37)-N6)-threonylcarbamoyltransferase complex transferase subunit TsaD [Candidatus Aminicenantes bacterium]